MLNKIILYVSPFAVLLPLGVACIKYKEFDKENKILSLHLLLVTLFSLASATLFFLKRNNLLLLHILTMLEFITLTWFYATINNKWNRNLMIVLVVLFISLGFIDGFLIEGWFNFNTLARSAESLFVIVFAFTTYNKTLKELAIEKIQRSPLFWVNTGFLIYYAGSLFLFASSKYLIPLEFEYRIYVWTFHALLSSLLYVFIFTGLCYYKKA